MKGRLGWRQLVSALVCMMIWGAICFLIGDAIGSNAMFGKPEASPSGSYTFEKMYGYDQARYVRFVIKAKDEREYIPDEVYYIRHKTIIGWGENDTLWVYSSDVGTFYWRLVNGNWSKSAASDKSIISAPKEIQDEWKDLNI